MTRSLIQRLMFVVLILGMAASALHAEEVVCVDAPAAFEQGHEVGDSDEVPADDGKAYPHHHVGCSGHHIADHAATDGSTIKLASEIVRFSSHAPDLRSLASGPALRPPIA